jgi:hypothetical protein
MVCGLDDTFPTTRDVTLSPVTASLVLSIGKLISCDLKELVNMLSHIVVEIASANEPFAIGLTLVHLLSYFFGTNRFLRELLQLEEPPHILHICFFLQRILLYSTHHHLSLFFDSADSFLTLFLGFAELLIASNHFSIVTRGSNPSLLQGR